MAHNLFKTSFAIACLATSALSTSAVFASDAEIYFYPKYKWSVSKTAEAQGNVPATCSVKSELNNGYIVELSGTENGLRSLDIDFRQGAFDQGLKYEVQYSVAGASDTIVYSTAVSKKKLQGDLTHKSSFAEQLYTASAMDVRIRNNEFRIYLNGLNTALADFDNCVSSAPAMAAKTEEPSNIAKKVAVQHTEHTTGNVTPKQPALDSNTNLAPPPPLKTSLIDGVSEIPSNQDLSKEQLRPSPHNRPRYTEQIAERMKEESKKYKPAKAAPSPKNAAPQMQAEKIEPEASKMHDNALELAEASVTKSHSAAQPKSSKSVENYKSPKPVFNVTKNKEPIVADFTDVDDTKEEENAATYVQHKSAARSMLPSMEMAEMQPASGHDTEDASIMRSKISDLEKQLASMMEKNRMLDNELKGALRDSEKEKLSVSSDNWNLELATMKYNEAERQIMRLGRKLQTQKAQCDMEKTELENMLFDPKLTNQQQLAKLSSLEGQLEEAKLDLLRQQRLYEERIRIMQEQLSAQ